MDQSLVVKILLQIKALINSLLERLGDGTPEEPEVPDIPVVAITHMPAPGQRGDHVKILQERLNEFGFDTGLIDGVFGPKTKAATSEFQKSIGLAGSGIPGPKTIEALGIKLSVVVDEAPSWLLKARGELGVSEVPGSQHNPRIIEYHATTTLKATADEVAWCSSFVNWCMIQAGLKGTNSAAARSWLSWGVPLDGPRIGAIFVEWRVDPNGWQGHVGLVDNDANGNWVLLGGNQGNSVTNRAWNTSRLLGYRWPAGVPLEAPVIEVPDLKLPWNNEEWTAHLLSQIDDEMLSVVPTDIDEFCPEYASLTTAKRREFYARLFCEMARHESSFKPETSYQENFNDRHGNRVISRGLFQLSIESANGYQGISFTNAQDLHNPIFNITCAVIILRRWVMQDKRLAGRVGTDWRGAARYWSVMRDTNSKFTQIRDAMRRLNW